MAADVVVAATNLHGKLAKIRSRFYERGEQLQKARSAASALVEDVKDNQASLNRSKDKVIEEPENVAALKVVEAEEVGADGRIGAFQSGGW